MSKKGYQKGLPAILPEPASKPRPPSVPAPRASAEDLRVVPPPQVVSASTRPVRDRHRVMRVIAVSIAVPVSFALGALVTSLVLGGTDHRLAENSPGSAQSAAPPPLAGEGSYVESYVQDNGDVTVHQWIRVGEPIEELRLALPDVPGTGLSVDRVVVVAEGRVNGPARISARGTTYTFSPTKVVQVSYRMRGAVTRSNDDGRALVVATNLDVTYPVQSERETRVVRAAEVLTLACARTATTAPVPCGTADNREQWRVELPGSRSADRVVAQVNLG